MRKIIYIAVLMLAVMSASAQTSNYEQRYDLLVSKFGPAGVGVETVLDNWAKADSTNMKMLTSRFKYYFTKAQRTEVVKKPTKKYLGMDPLISLKDTTGADIYYYQETFYDDELYASALKAADKLITLYPDHLDYRFLKANAYISYEKESPDMALASLLALAEEDSQRKKAWIYEGEQADKDFFQEFLNSEEEIFTKDVEFDGTSYIFVASKIEGTTACVATLVPQTTVTAQAIEIKNTTILVVIIAVVFASLIGVIVSTGISSAISHMLKQTKKVAEGDLTVTVATKKKDEFRILADGLSGMIAHTKHLIAKVEGISGNLVDSVEAVTSSATVIYEASDHIHGAAGEIEAGVNQQADESVSCLDQMDSLSHKLEKLNQNTKIINEIVHVTAGAVGDGVYNMDSLNEKTKSTTSITKNVIETIQLLEVKSRSIGAIVNAIDDIAEQTNLLSLNASIEAARAGAAGKGFVVVADEIRKLAEQSSVSANKIEEIIDEIVDSTSKAVKIAMEAQEIVHEQEVAVSSTTSSFENIDNQIKKLSRALEDILVSVQEIDSARIQTLAAIENISAVSEENASASTTVNDAAAKQLDMVVQLEETAKILSEHANELAESIKQFKVR